MVKQQAVGLMATSNMIVCDQQEKKILTYCIKQTGQVITAEGQRLIEKLPAPRAGFFFPSNDYLKCFNLNY